MSKGCLRTDGKFGGTRGLDERKNFRSQSKALGSCSGAAHQSLVKGYSREAELRVLKCVNWSRSVTVIHKVNAAASGLQFLDYLVRDTVKLKHHDH